MSRFERKIINSDWNEKLKRIEKKPEPKELRMGNGCYGILCGLWRMIDDHTRGYAPNNTNVQYSIVLSSPFFALIELFPNFYGGSDAE